MTDIELKRIQEMPKVILHLHLDGSLRPETIHEWIVDGSIKAETIYKWFGKQAKDVTLEEVKQALMLAKDWKGDLNEYLQKFDLPLVCLQTEEHIEQATYEIFEDLAKQNVIYAEVRFAPSKHTENGLSYNQVVEAAIRGMNKAKEEYGINGNLLLCCMREEIELDYELIEREPRKLDEIAKKIAECIRDGKKINKKDLEIFKKGKENVINSIKTIATAYKYLKKGVCGVDLAGAEGLYTTKDHEYIFKIIKELEIPLTIHAGEADGPQSVKIASEYADRIGHGIRSIEDLKLVAELVQNGMILEICPTSNIQTNAIKEVYKVIEDLYRKGVKIVINTDNNTVSNINLVEEYKKLLENTGLKPKDFRQMNIYGRDGAFETPQKKAELKIEVDEESINNDIEK